MASFVRGSSIHFSAVCKDAFGEPFTPTAAVLSVSFVGPAGRVDATAAMTIAGNVVSVAWDSSVALDTMPVAWHIRASNDLAKVAQDGSFVLTAAAANPT